MKTPQQSRAHMLESLSHGSRSRRRPPLLQGKAARRAAVLAAVAFALVTGTVMGQERGQYSSTAFAYQGELMQHGKSAEGHYDVTFDLYDQPSGGTFLGRVEHSAVSVLNGGFSAEVDFGFEVLSGADLWLEVQVRGESNNDFSTLEPRQLLTQSAAGSACTVEGDLAVNGQIFVDAVAEAGLLLGCCNEATLDGGGQLAVGGFLTNLLIDSDEIQVQGLGQGSNLFLNPEGGNVGIGVTATDAPLHVRGSPDASPSGGGALVVGPINGNNIAIDSNEIMARNAGSAKALFLNLDGGDVVFGGGIDIGYEIVLTSSGREAEQAPGRGFTVQVAAICPAGKRVLGGGCTGQDILQSFPSSGGTRWICNAEGSVTARAICARIK